MDILEAKELWRLQNQLESRWNTEKALDCVKAEIERGKSFAIVGILDCTGRLDFGAQFFTHEAVQGAEAMQALGFKARVTESNSVWIEGWASQESEAKNED